MSETFKIENEIWKDIGGYEGLYQVSDMGRVKSLSRIVKCREFTRTIKTRILKQYPRPDGYMQVNLKLNGRQKTFNVHRLVAETFIPNPENKIDVDHINGNKEINSVSNLRWATRVENLNNRRKKKKGGNSKVILKKKNLESSCYRIRKLTPLECWRLQGFEDEDFKLAKNQGVSDSQLYKQAGNSITTNVLYYIFKNLFKEYIIN